MPTQDYKERKQAYIKRYIKEHYKLVTTKVCIEKDADILAKLDSVPNKSEYIKSLIRADLAK